MVKLEKFIENLMIKINETINCYYEEATKDASFLFGIVPTITFNPLNYGYSCIFDIELYNNELSDKSIEQVCDELRENLDNYSFQNEDVGFHLGFESQILTKQNEQDLIYRRISFSAKIF